jgi:hypothetical protein
MMLGFHTPLSMKIVVATIKSVETESRPGSTEATVSNLALLSIHTDVNQHSSLGGTEGLEPRPNIESDGRRARLFKHVLRRLVFGNQGGKGKPWSILKRQRKQRGGTISGWSCRAYGNSCVKELELKQSKSQRDSKKRSGVIRVGSGYGFGGHSAEPPLPPLIRIPLPGFASCKYGSNMQAISPNVDNLHAERSPRTPCSLDQLLNPYSCKSSSAD